MFAAMALHVFVEVLQQSPPVFFLVSAVTNISSNITPLSETVTPNTPDLVFTLHSAVANPDRQTKLFVGNQFLRTSLTFSLAIL
jgi:hypothetical protein